MLHVICISQAGESWKIWVPVIPTGAGGGQQGLEHTFHKSGGKTSEFHLSSFKGEIYSVTEQEVPDAPLPPKPRYSMYGEEVDEQPSMWKED